MASSGDERKITSYRHSEPLIIDDDVLTELIFDQGPQNFARKIAEEEGVDFDVIKDLRLDYKNILQINNLWRFKSLVRLQLDNNKIEKIENLSSLITLVWLDLSFNCIDKIEGLQALVRLEDLSLFNNQISVLENFDTLINLQVLSIGNNELKDIRDLIYLRQFKRLNTLNLQGNPLSKHKHYMTYTAALLKKHLIFLDYFLVDSTTIDKGMELFDIQMQQLDQDDDAKEYSRNYDLQIEKRFKYCVDVFVENLDDGKMFDLMYENETAIIKLDLVHEASKLRQDYRLAFDTNCQAVFDVGMSKYDERMQEVEQFKESARQAIANSKAISSAKINKFLTDEIEWEDSLEFITKKDSALLSLVEFNQMLKQLKEELLDDELLLVDQLEEMVNDFTLNIREIMGGFEDCLRSNFTKCRNLENIHHERMMDMVTIVMDKLIHNQLDDEIEAQLSEILVDKEYLATLQATSHDIHLLRIDQREDSSLKRANKWVNDLLNDIHDRVEHARNRESIVEIEHFVAFHQRLANEIIEVVRNDIVEVDALFSNLTTGSRPTSGTAVVDDGAEEEEEEEEYEEQEPYAGEYNEEEEEHEEYEEGEEEEGDDHEDDA